MLYFGLTLNERLHNYLADIDTRARNKLHLLVTQLAEKEGINEQPKSGGRNLPPRADLWGGCRISLLEKF